MRNPIKALMGLSIAAAILAGCGMFGDSTPQPGLKDLSQAQQVVWLTGDVEGVLAVMREATAPDAVPAEACEYLVHGAEGLATLYEGWVNGTAGGGWPALAAAIARGLAYVRSNGLLQGIDAAAPTPNDQESDAAVITRRVEIALLAVTIAAAERQVRVAEARALFADGRDPTPDELAGLIADVRRKAGLVHCGE